MHITGSRDGPPVKVGVAVTDLTTGLYTSNAIMAALLSRARTGKGQHIDVALSDCQVATLSNLASSALISGKPDSGRWGTAHPSIVPYKGFKTKDGDVMLGGGNDRLFGVLCERLGKPEWRADERFVSNALRVKNRDLLEGMIEEITTTKTTKEWLEVMEGSGMPYAAINDVQATLRHEHGELGHPCMATDVVQHITDRTGSVGERHGQRGRAPDLWTNQTGQYAREIFIFETRHQECTTNAGAAHGRGVNRAWDEQGKRGESEEERYNSVSRMMNRAVDRT